MFLPKAVSGAMMTFMRVTVVFCMLIFTAHAATPSIANSFDHARTGFLLRDVHTSLMCEQCHVEGIFKNTPRDCAGCHTLGSRVGATPKPVNHVQTSKACDACHTSPTSFLVKNYNHAGITKNCVSCHNGQSAGVIAKPASHFPTTLACEACHINTATFASTRMDHAGITGNCTQCHGGQFPGIVGKAATHITTNGACETCHSASNTSNFTTFQGARFDHYTTTSACSSCHNGGTAIAKPATHIPTTGACDTCHTPANTNNFLTFQGAQFNHVTASPAVANTCSSCHNGGTATGKPSFHITTAQQCDSSGCHTSTTTQNYTTFLGAVFDHATAIPAVVNRCSTCHGGQSAGVTSKQATHFPTTAQCDTCHTASNTANYSSFQGGSFNHAATSPAVSGICSTCHGGSYTGVVVKPAAHVSTSSQCDICHTASNTGNYTTFTGATFNHDATTPPVAGICSACHDGVIARGKSSFHTPTSQQCDSSGCHTRTNTSNYTTFLGALVNHATIVPPVANRCSECHNNTNALGKHSAHVTTTSECDTCHTVSNTQNYSSFAGATFNHATATPSVANNCSSCHNGQFANVVKKPALHIPTAVQCDVCHTAGNTQNYTSFTGATFNHTTATPAVGGICSTCHGGQYPNIIKKPTLHMATTSECDSSGCHTNTSNYTTFAGATFNHSAVTPPVGGRCSECHNGVIATGKTNWHMATVAQCDSCHTQANTSNYTTFTGAAGSVDHTAYGPGSCYTGCHNGSNAKGLSAGHIPTATISCDGCHAKFNGTSVTSFANPAMDHTRTTSIRCDLCHNGSYTAQGNNGGALGKMVNHIPTTITNPGDCTACHPITPVVSVAAMNWGTETMNHNGAQGGGSGGNGAYCVTCHLKGVTYQGSMDKKSHEGTSMTKDCSKSSCHKPLGSKGAAYTRWK